jgi:hypothetical protein
MAEPPARDLCHRRHPPWRWLMTRIVAAAGIQPLDHVAVEYDIPEGS